MENQWLTWAKQLQGIASTGLSFCDDPYDRERYEQVSGIATQMLAMLADCPISSIKNLDTDFGLGYATPRIDVRGAVFKNDKILLVQESSDGLWTMPGGYADIGLSAKENVIKEIQEEASVVVQSAELYGVRHKARHDYAQDVRDFYKLFFVCHDGGSAEPVACGVETIDVGYFSKDKVPLLSTGRVLEKDIVAAFDYAAEKRVQVFCD